MRSPLLSVYFVLGLVGVAVGLHALRAGLHSWAVRRWFSLRRARRFSAGAHFYLLAALFIAFLVLAELPFLGPLVLTLGLALRLMLEPRAYHDPQRPLRDIERWAVRFSLLRLLLISLLIGGGLLLTTNALRDVPAPSRRK